ncbi:MAG TPA: polysaccharide deacetylase family protein [Arthrobacter sp.]
MAAASLRTVVAALCAAAVICGGDTPVRAPAAIPRADERVSSIMVPVAMPRALAGVLQRPAGVPGGHPMSLTAQVGARQVRASWTYLDGMPRLNEHLDSWLLGILDAATPAGGRYRPAMALNAGQPTPQALTISAEPVQASGTLVIVREKVEDVGVGSVSSATLYFDTVSGALHRGADLLRPDAVRDVQARLLGVPGGIAAASSPEPAVSDLVLNSAGELSVTAEQSAAPGRAGRELTTTLNASDTADVLSDYGRQALAQLNTAAAPLPVTPPAFRHINCDLVPCAALTYDDGPDAHGTPQLLGILKEKNAQATFFMTGSNTAANPAIARQVADAGHAIGNHTFSHPYLTKLSAPAVRNEIDRTDAAILAATGSTPTIMRPPYGAADAAVQGAVGKPLIIWAVDSLDWQSKNPAAFVPKVVKEITPGAVVLMHDVQPTTIAGQQELISTLQSQGYRLVTVPQLFEGTPLVPGHVYRSRPARQ